jgi:hypothetical protein
MTILRPAGRGGGEGTQGARVPGDRRHVATAAKFTTQKRSHPRAPQPRVYSFLEDYRDDTVLVVRVLHLGMSDSAD